MLIIIFSHLIILITWYPEVVNKGIEHLTILFKNCSVKSSTSLELMD